MALLKLSGWQRLWVVVSLLYLVTVVIFTIALMPKRANIEQAWESEIDAIVGSNIRFSLPFRDMNDEALVRVFREEYPDAYQDLSDEELVSTISIRVALIDFRHQQRLDSLFGEQAKSMGIGLLAWIVPSVVLYLLGWSIGWVYRGFQSRSDG